MGQVNCYLFEQNERFALVDTGSSNQRAMIDSALEKAGCRPGDLQLIVLTHGDFDHIGNAAYFRRKFGARIAMHPGDLAMATEGDMFFNRHRPNIIVQKLISLLAGFGPEQRFHPDVDIQHGDRLDDYGFPAEAISLPGHSKGSIGLLLQDGSLFCGDLFENRDRPALNGIMDNLEEARASAARLQEMQIGTVYPGHGAPFLLSEFSLETRAAADQN